MSDEKVVDEEASTEQPVDDSLPFDAPVSEEDQPVFEEPKEESVEEPVTESEGETRSDEGVEKGDEEWDEKSEESSDNNGWGPFPQEW